MRAPLAELEVASARRGGHERNRVSRSAVEDLVGDRRRPFSFVCNMDKRYQDVSISLFTRFLGAWTGRRKQCLSFVTEHVL